MCRLISAQLLQSPVQTSSLPLQPVGLTFSYLFLHKADQYAVLTVESRHSAYIRSAGNGLAPFPSAYDVPLDFNQVYSLASMFIDSCPDTNPKLAFKAFPRLSAEVQGNPVPGGMVKLVPEDLTVIQDKGQLYAVSSIPSFNCVEC